MYSEIVQGVYGVHEVHISPSHVNVFRTSAGQRIASKDVHTRDLAILTKQDQEHFMGSHIPDSVLGYDSNLWTSGPYEDEYLNGHTLGLRQNPLASTDSLVFVCEIVSLDPAVIRVSGVEFPRSCYTRCAMAVNKAYSSSS